MFDRDASFRELVEEQYRLFSGFLGHIPCESYVARMVELDAHGYAEKAVVYRQLAAEFGLTEGVAEQLNAHFLDSYHLFCRCFPEVPSALKTLRANGFKLGIITNGTVRMQARKIHQLGLADLMDAVLISEQEGLRKPERAIFEKALQKIAVTADQAWYVGDHPVVDIRGAFEAGLTPVWRYTPHWKRPDVPAQEIQTMDELARLMN